MTSLFFFRILTGFLFLSHGLQKVGLLEGEFAVRGFIAKNGVLPIMNKGELALLYIAAFAVLFTYGAGSWSLERLVFKKESF